MKIRLILIAAILSQGVVAMDDKQVSADAKGLLNDLNAYRKCRNTGCPPELIARLQNRGYAIAKGVAAVAVIAGAAYGAKRLHGRYQSRKLWHGKWGTVYPNLESKFGFQNTTKTEDFLRAAYKGDRESLTYVKEVSREAIKAGVFIARERGHAKLATEISDAYMTRFKRESIYNR